MPKARREHVPTRLLEEQEDVPMSGSWGCSGSDVGCWTGVCGVRVEVLVSIFGVVGLEDGWG